jgi:hypothetical protein
MLGLVDVEDMLKFGYLFALPLFFLSFFFTRNNPQVAEEVACFTNQSVQLRRQSPKLGDRVG